MSELSVGTISGLAANSYVIDVASGSNIAIPSSSMPAGTVLQVVSATNSDGTTTSVTNFWANTGLTATITPRSESSKIYIAVSGNLRHSHSAATSFAGIHRGDETGTLLMSVSAYQNQHASSVFIFPTHMTFLDSPATTSPQQYTATVLTNSSTNTAIWNPNGNVCSITLMEIAQ
jgi:hypothetical protein